nr:helix-turn-helix domain-containing protein [uncultured Actinoplanes sp.]
MPESLAAGPAPRLEDPCALRSFAVLAARPDYSVTAVTCRDDHRRWSVAESRDSYRLVLVRRGRFRRRTAGVPVDVDPTVAYLGVPGEEEHFAHPTGRGDACTMISMSPPLWRALAGEAPPRRTAYVDAAMDLTHRRLLRATDDVDYALAEQLTRLVRPPTSRRPPHDHVTDRAREAIQAGHPAAETLFTLAALLDTSPYRLSRAFTRELGVSMTHYRNRVRVARAMDRLEAGDTLATVAADLGFADQPHLTRTVKAHLGHTPTALRTLLTRAGTAATAG